MNEAASASTSTTAFPETRPPSSGLPVRTARSSAWSLWVVGLVVFGCVVFAETRLLSFKGQGLSRVTVAGAVSAVVVCMLMGGLMGLLIGSSSRKRPITGFAIGAFLAFVLSAIGSLGALRNSDEQRQQTLESLTDIQQLMSRAISNPSDTKPQFGETKPLEGDVGEIDKFMRTAVTRAATSRAAFRQELVSIGWFSLINADRIKNDKSFLESKATIAKAKSIVDKYDKERQTWIPLMETEVASSSMSPSLKSDVLAGLRKSIVKTGPRIDRLWELENQIVQTKEQVILMLEKSKKWRISDGKFVFSQPDELDQFRSYLGKIKDLAQQEKQIQQETLAETNSGIEAAKEELKK
jgi:hypothetical protein